jgi:uncharacterized protein YlzI (FlbEa/FlbD family)
MTKLSKYHIETNKTLKLYNQELIVENWSIVLVNKHNEIVAKQWRQTVVDKIIDYHKQLETSQT